MPKCDCSQCSHRSATKCNSHREEKCIRKRSPKRKPKSCECNKCKPPACDCNKCKPRACEYNRCKQSVKPICKCEDSDNDSDSAADCNAQLHQFIITVKTTN